ncbi:hypothetical protein HHI36_022120, partial [Cryptolaemus montrouzieri]
MTGTIFSNEHQCLAFANDLTLIAKSKKELQKITTRVIQEAKTFGLVINQDKTKFMVMGNTEE